MSDQATTNDHPPQGEESKAAVEAQVDVRQVMNNSESRSEQTPQLDEGGSGSLASRKQQPRVSSPLQSRGRKAAPASATNVQAGAVLEPTAPVLEPQTALPSVSPRSGPTIESENGGSDNVNSSQPRVEPNGAIEATSPGDGIASAAGSADAARGRSGDCGHVTTARPAYVGKEFAGRCKLFPKRDTILLPYQAKWVLDNGRLKAMEKARQIGLSWSTAYRLVSTTSLKDARYDDWVSSRDDLQARLLIQDCKNFASILAVAADDLGERVIDDGKHSAFVLRYANGHQTHSLSSNPDAQAGKRGRRVLDEFALHPDPRKLYAITYPGITWGGSMEIISTHRGSGNYFAELIGEIRHKGNPKGFSLHRVTLQDALDQGFLYKLQTKLPPEDPRQEMDESDYFNFIRAGCVDEESFQQEFCCVPADDAAAFLSYDLIAGCEYPLADLWAWTMEQLGAKDLELYLGIDVGRTADLTVFWLLQRVGDVMFTRLIHTFQGTPFSTQEEYLHLLMSLPGVRRACIDRTGIGHQFTERAQQRYGEYRVEAIVFTPAVKEELAYPVRAAFEDRTVRVPNDKFVRSDLRAIRKETTASGNVRFSADRGPGGHADRFWSLALALHAGKRAKSGPIYYSSVEPLEPNPRRSM